MPDSGKKARPKAREPWIIRTYAGFGDARQANERFLANLKQGQRGLSIAFDLPTQNGYDPDAPVARGEVGEAGVSICHWNDMERLFEGIPLQSINTSMTINATAPFILALYLVVAEKHGVPWTELRGTTQNDLLKEFVARGTSIFHPELSFRLSTELIRFTVERVPDWNPINCCGYHYMESGAGPAEEIGYAFGNALLILDAIRPKLDAAAFEQTVRRISFFINSGIELVPEICKVRAYFKLWRELCSSEYGVDNVAFRAGCQVRSLTLTEPQPEVNIIRIAYEALPVVISADARVNALQLPGFREALALPDQSEQTLSLRTQQVLMHETGLAGYGDIFEGSKVIEKLTGETAARAREIAIRLREAGYSRAISIVSGELTRQLAERYRKVDSGEIVQIGVNAFTGEVGLTPWPRHSADHAADASKEKERIEAIKKWRAARDQAAVSKAREALERAAANNSDSDRGLIEATIELARAGGTVGEWTDSLVRVSRGRYTPPILETSVSVGALNVPVAASTRNNSHRARQGRPRRAYQRDQAARPRLHASRDGSSPRGFQADAGADGGHRARGRRRRARHLEPRRRPHVHRARDNRSAEKSRRRRRVTRDGRNHSRSRPHRSARAWRQGGLHAQGLQPRRDRRPYHRDRGPGKVKG